MLFATNRTPKESTRSKLNRKITFPLQNTTVSQNMYFCERKGEDDYVELGRDVFFQRLKDLPDKDTQILFYIHGFNNTGEADIFPNAKKLQACFDEVAGEGLVYVVPLIWPCDDDSIVAFVDDYWDDQRAADASGIAFARMLGKFDSWREEEAKKARKNPDAEICTRRMNVLAHSMGNRVLRNSLASWAKIDSAGKMPQLFRNVFMVAADVVNHALEKGEEGEYIADSARNVVVYYANDDLSMPASKVINLKNRTTSLRMGMTGPEALNKVARNVFEVDCDNFNNTFDFPKGHSYFLRGPDNVVSPVVRHMVKAIENGRVKPDNRHHELEKP